MKLSQLNDDQVKVFQAIFYMAMQLILIIAALVAFFIVLPQLLASNNGFDLAKYGAIEAILSGTLFKAYWYYFTNKLKEPSKRKVGKTPTTRTLATINEA
jgi:hypothetical protein